MCSIPQLRELQERSLWAPVAAAVIRMLRRQGTPTRDWVSRACRCVIPKWLWARSLRWAQLREMSPPWPPSYAALSSAIWYASRLFCTPHSPPIRVALPAVLLSLRPVNQEFIAYVPCHPCHSHAHVAIFSPQSPAHVKPTPLWDRCFVGVPNVDNVGRRCTPPYFY